MVSWQMGPTRHADAWQIVSFWQDTLDVGFSIFDINLHLINYPMDYILLKARGGHIIV